MHQPGKEHKACPLDAGDYGALSGTVKDGQQGRTILVMQVRVDTILNEHLEMENLKIIRETRLQNVP